MHFPGIGRQRNRVGPQLQALQRAFEQKRLELQQAAPLDNPELVLVLEVAGTVQNLVRAVQKVPGLEWLLELTEEDIDPDDDFYAVDDDGGRKSFDSKLYLIGSNQQALEQLVGLWNEYRRNPEAKFPRGLAPIKHVFEQLRVVRYWDAQDRIDADMRAYWQFYVDANAPAVRFEIEAWHSPSADKNRSAQQRITRLVEALRGRVLRQAIVDEIAYNGLLVELPTEAIRRILAGETPDLVLSERVMFFRPKAQALTGTEIDPAAPVAMPAAAGAVGDPVVAILDGVPLANHPLLAGRVVVDDPDNWAARCEARYRSHGTAMASLVLNGELDGTPAALGRRVYLRPILLPDPADPNPRRAEKIPDDELLLDLVHRAVRRICVGEGGGQPAAPSVRVVNLSVCDPDRLFGRQMSPWARLLDYLSATHGLLFVVSAGNDSTNLNCNIGRGDFDRATVAQRREVALKTLLTDSANRRLISPAESINALTVGALHTDGSTPVLPADRFDLFEAGGVSPISRVGAGYRRAVKPDILMPGGRALHQERLGGAAPPVELSMVNFGVAPGHRVAAPPLPGEAIGATTYSRGTSNAAALASRATSQIYDVIQDLRASEAGAPDHAYDAVLLKTMLVHGARWGDLAERVAAQGPNFAAIANGNARRIAKQEFITRWLGYGPVDLAMGTECAAHRATLLGVGELSEGEAAVFLAPLPPGLASTTEWRRLTLTLGWLSPINSRHQAYRKARLWAAPPDDPLPVARMNSVFERAALRGTLQHEVLEGTKAAVYKDGAVLQCKVNCAEDAGSLTESVRFALCLSLEVAVESRIPVYQQVRDRVKPPVRPRARG